MSIDLDAIQARREAYMRGETSQQTIFEIVADIPAILAYARDLEARNQRGNDAVFDVMHKWRAGSHVSYSDIETIRAALTATEGQA